MITVQVPNITPKIVSIVNIKHVNCTCIVMYCVVLVLFTVNLCLDWQGIIKCTSNSPLFIVLVLKEKVGRGA